MPALRRQRQSDLCDFKAGLIYIYREFWVSQGDTVMPQLKIKYNMPKGLEQVFF